VVATTGIDSSHHRLCEEEVATTGIGSSRRPHLLPPDGAETIGIDNSRLKGHLLLGEPATRYRRQVGSEVPPSFLPVATNKKRKRKKKKKKENPIHSRESHKRWATKATSLSQNPRLLEMARTKQTVKQKDKKDKGKGKPAAKRHERKSKRPQGVEGIPRNAFKRLARRAGLTRVSGTFARDARKLLKFMLVEVLQRAALLTAHMRQKTISAGAMREALKESGMRTAGFE